MKKVKHGGPIRTGSLSAENIALGRGPAAPAGQHGSHVKLGGVTLKRRTPKR